MFQRSRQARRRDGGFTLLEPLLGILIIGALSGATAIAVDKITTGAKVAACQSDKKAVEMAAQGYHLINEMVWAPDIPTLVSAGYLDKAPSTTNGYTITYNGTTGAVTATGVCS